MAIADILGWTFMLIAVGSYFLGTIGKWSFDSLSYQLCQVVSCGMAFTAAYLIHYIPYMGFNLLWGSIALIKLVILLKKKHRSVVEQADTLLSKSSALKA